MRTTNPKFLIENDIMNRNLSESREERASIRIDSIELNMSGDSYGFSMRNHRGSRVAG